MNNILLSNLRKNLDKKKDSQENLVEVNLLDFELLDIIGQGAFGKVMIASGKRKKRDLFNIGIIGLTIGSKIILLGAHY